MDPDRRRRIEELCDAALDRDDRERAAFVAAACGTVTARAMRGTASEPKPAPKPLLLMPRSSTAGMAAA